VFVRSTHLERASCNEIIDNGLFPFGRSKDPAYTLNVFARALAAAYNNRHVGCRHIDTFVEHTRRYEDPQIAGTEALKRARPLLFPNVAGDRLYEMLTGYRVGSIIVGRENEVPGIIVA
jgi:hypothetical protein